MSDDPNLRRVLGYLLRSHVAYQDGGQSNAPTLVFADADYEDGDGTCGLHADGKQANEPAIVYVRSDALLHVIAERDALATAIKRVEKAYQPFENTDHPPRSYYAALLRAEREAVRLADAALRNGGGDDD